MKKYELFTPEGTRDLLFDDVIARRKAETALRDLIGSAGFCEVITPGIEYAKLFDAGVRKFPQESLYRLTDRQGQLLALRPDSTLAIARIARTRLAAAKRPLKLYYSQHILRANPENKGHENEVHQFGAEIIGDGDNACGTQQIDLQALNLAVRALQALNLPDIKLEIGAAALFGGITKLLKIPRHQKEYLRRLIQKKSLAELYAATESIPNAEAKTALRALPELFGGEEVFGKAQALFSFSSEAADCLTEVQSLFYALKAHCGDILSVDLAMVNNVDYYTGVVFKGYAGGYGKTILSGGRYAAFPNENEADEQKDSESAIGFAVDLNAVTQITTSNHQIIRDNIRIALTKGRLAEKTAALFAHAGLNIEPLQNPGRRLLLNVGQIGGVAVECVLAKAADVITYVERGVCDLGILGKDTIEEYGGKFFEIRDLGFGKCRFALAGKADADFYGGHGIKCVASKYVNVTKHYFESKHMDVDIVKIEGSVELAPLLGLADGIVDIVETGATLKENGLSVYETVMDISARMIANPVSFKTKRKPIAALLEKMENKEK
jgi:ATP phosphoribosyltransferase regulatory subunit